jgi:hypothetical protein
MIHVVFQIGQMTSQVNREVETVNREVEETKAKQMTWLDRTFRDREGNIVIAQVPNLPILVGVTATLLHFVLPSEEMQTMFGLIGFGALFTWAWQELFAGVNYFRRSLGLIGLVSLLAVGLNLIGI